MADDDVAPPKIAEDNFKRRLARLEQISAQLILDVAELEGTRIVVFATFGAFAVMLAAKDLLTEDDVDRLVAMTERIAAEMSDLDAKGIPPEDWFRSMPKGKPGRRREPRKRPRARK